MIRITLFEGVIKSHLRAESRVRGFTRQLSGKEPTCQCRRYQRCGFNFWVRKIPIWWKWDIDGGKIGKRQ